MTRDQAVERCAQLNRAADGPAHWFPHQTQAGDWEIVSVAAGGFRRPGPLKTATGARPQPPDQPDPRPSIFRNIPPFGPG